MFTKFHCTGSQSYRDRARGQGQALAELRGHLWLGSGKGKVSSLVPLALENARTWNSPETLKELGMVR